MSWLRSSNPSRVWLLSFSSNFSISVMKKRRRWRTIGPHTLSLPSWLGTHCHNFSLEFCYSTGLPFTTGHTLTACLLYRFCSLLFNSDLICRTHLYRCSSGNIAESAQTSTDVTLSFVSIRIATTDLFLQVIKMRQKTSGMTFIPNFLKIIAQNQKTRLFTWFQTLSFRRIFEFRTQCSLYIRTLLRQQQTETYSLFCIEPSPGIQFHFSISRFCGLQCVSEPRVILTTRNKLGCLRPLSKLYRGEDMPKVTILLICVFQCLHFLKLISEPALRNKKWNLIMFTSPNRDQPVSS
jgi:hypothetical protein